MKRSNKVLVLAMVICLSAFVFNTLTCSAGEFEAIYTTGSSGSTAPKSSFKWNDTPWLYVKLPNDGLNVVSAWWKNPDTDFSFTADASNAQEKWLTVNNWNDVKKVGDWNIDAMYFFANNPSNAIGTGSAKFTVAPEPLSSALFLAGAGALAVARRNRKQKTS